MTKCDGQSVFTSVLCVLALALLSAAAVGATISYVPDAGGPWNAPGNWSLGRNPITNDDVEIIVSGTVNKIVDYDYSGTSGFNSITIDGGGVRYGMLLQTAYSILTDYVYIGEVGEAWYWMEGDAFLWALEDLHVGHYSTGPGHFYMQDADNGVLVNGDTYVGYHAPGDFDHRNGAFQCSHLFVGQNEDGTYWLSGPTDTSTITTGYYTVVGNGDDGLFEQTGGTFDNTAGTLHVGLNSGGWGTYLMKGGQLDANYISIAYNGEGFFTQSGGTVTTIGNIRIGTTGTHVLTAEYVLNEDDGTSQLDVGDHLLVGPETPGKYQQTAGTADVTNNVYVYTTGELYLDGGHLTANQILNNGYVEHNGGILEANGGANSAYADWMIDNTANCQISSLSNTSGRIELVDGFLRGREVMPGVHLACEFTNEAEFVMSGGLYGGHLTNNGTFNYYGGDFSNSRLTNNGTFNNYAPFTCLRLVSNSDLSVSSTHTITADGAGYANAIESNDSLVMYAGGTITLTSDKPLVNNGPMYAGGTLVSPATIYGDVVNNDYLLPATGSATGGLDVQGDFEATIGAELRIRIGGTTAVTDYDRVSVQGTATLAGELDVRLINSFVPSAGDSFSVVGYGTRSGQFNPVYLPALPPNLKWSVTYTTQNLVLSVVKAALVASEPPADGMLPKTQNNIILCRFDAPIALPALGNPLFIAEMSDPNTDLSNRFTYTVDPNDTGDPSGETLKAIEIGAQLPNQRWFNVQAAPTFDVRWFSFDVCTLRGDANNTGRVTTADYSEVKAHLGERTDARYDLNGSARITTADYSVVKACLGTRTPPKP